METRIERFGRFTIAEVKETVTLNGKVKKFTGVGISRLSDDDRYNKQRAEGIALGRAMKSLKKKQQGKRINQSFMG